jgi:hypothetical protein
MPPKVRLATAATLAIITTACSSAPHSSADPSTETPPFPIGRVGTPVHAKAASGATADITLNSAAWFPPGCSGGWSCNVIELTVIGTSATPFKYNETYVVSGYGGGDQPFTHPNDNHWRGGDDMVDYTKINKMPPLRTGSVANGQTTHGFIGYGGNLNEGDLYIKFCDPDQGGTADEAGWKVHT